MKYNRVEYPKNIIGHCHAKISLQLIDHCVRFSLVASTELPRRIGRSTKIWPRWRLRLFEEVSAGFSGSSPISISSETCWAAMRIPQTDVMREPYHTPDASQYESWITGHEKEAVTIAVIATPCQFFQLLCQLYDAVVHTPTETNASSSFFRFRHPRSRACSLPRSDRLFSTSLSAYVWISRIGLRVL